MARQFKHLTFEDRKYIEKMYKFRSTREIADYLEVSVSAVNRELSRCEKGAYNAREAQIDRDKKREKITESVRQRWNYRRSTMDIYGFTRQIKTCLQINPESSPEEIARILGADVKEVMLYYATIKREINASLRENGKGVDSYET